MGLIMPDDQLIERNVLGCILSGADIPPVLDAGMFASPRNRIVFKSLTAMKDQGNEAPDILTLTHYLQSIGKLEEAGGAADVASLTDGVFPSQIQYLAETLVKRCRDRKDETAIKHAAENIGKEPTEWIVQDLQNKLEAQAELLADKKRDRKPHFEKIGKLAFSSSAWVIKDIFCLGDLIMFYGDSGTYKSFLAIALGLCVAIGVDFYGHPVRKRGSVFYIASEGSAGIYRRALAWCQENSYGIRDIPFYRYSGSANLIDDAGALINALEECAKTETEPPMLAVLDTLQRGLGGDDSDTGDSAAGLAALDHIRARWPEMAILLVHHVGQADKSRARGAYLWRAALDQEFRIEKSDPKNTADTTVNLRHTKSKESEPIAPMSFTLRKVQLVDDDGKPIRNEDGEAETSAVLDRAEYTSILEEKEKRLGRNQKLALDVLTRLETGNAGGIEMEAWAKACGIPKQRFYDARTSLEQLGKIRLQDGLYSSVRDSGNGSPVTVRPPYKGGPLPTVTDVTNKSPGNETLPTVTAVTEKGGNVEDSTPSNTQPDTPAAVEPELAIW
jgi:hypothetical protein